MKCCLVSHFLKRKLSKRTKHKLRIKAKLNVMLIAYSYFQKETGRMCSVKSVFQSGC